MPGPASRLYAQNIVNLVTLMTAKDDEGDPVFAPDYADEILSGSCVTQGGRIVHEPTREAIEGAAETAEPAPSAEPVETTEPGTRTSSTDAVPPDPQLDLPYDQEADQ
jgi:NAD(P) transhydrogenase subunit alpha